MTDDNDVVEIRKNPTFLQKENNELQKQVNELQSAVEGLKLLANEFYTLFAYLLKERCSGELKVSTETLALVTKGQEWQFMVGQEANGLIRTYTTKASQIVTAPGLPDKQKSNIIVIPKTGRVFKKHGS